MFCSELHYSYEEMEEDCLKTIKLLLTSMQLAENLGARRSKFAVRTSSGLRYFRQHIPPSVRQKLETWLEITALLASHELLRPISVKRHIPVAKFGVVMG